MARNGHKSSFAALVMSGARPAWVRPEYDRELERLAAEHEAGEPRDDRVAEPERLVTEQAMLPRDAFFAQSEMVEPDQAVGRIKRTLDRFRVVA